MEDAHEYALGNAELGTKPNGQKSSSAEFNYRCDGENTLCKL